MYHNINKFHETTCWKTGLQTNTHHVVTQTRCTRPDANIDTRRLTHTKTKQNTRPHLKLTVHIKVICLPRSLYNYER